MRDVASVSRGEHVYVHEGVTVSDGIFVGVFGGRIKVDHTTTYSFTPLGDERRWVTDVNWNVLTAAGLAGSPKPG